MKTAVVTGCAGGIGFATVRKLIASGFRVMGMDVAPFSDIQEKFMDFGGCFAYFSGDLAKSEDRAGLVQSALDFGGGIDVLVNVAGVAPKVRGDLLEMTEESYDRVMEINTKGTLFLSQLVSKEDPKPRGKRYQRVYRQYFLHVGLYLVDQPRRILHFQGRGVDGDKAVCRSPGRRGYFGE